MNQNRKLRGARVVGVFGVEAWPSPQSPFLLCLISKTQLKLQMGSKSLGLSSRGGFRIKGSSHLPGSWRYFFAARSVKFCKTFKLNTNILPSVLYGISSLNNLSSPQIYSFLQLECNYPESLQLLSFLLSSTLCVALVQN